MRVNIMLALIVEHMRYIGRRFFEIFISYFLYLDGRIGTIFIDMDGHGGSKLCSRQRRHDGHRFYFAKVSLGFATYI